MSKRFVLFICLLTTALTPLRADDNPPKLSAFTDFKAIRSAVIAPDGKTVACTVATASIDDNRATSVLWLVPTVPGPAKQVALETDSIDQVHWSPRGDRFVVQGKDRTTKENCLWIVDAAGNESRKLIAIDRGNHYLAHQGASLCWSPDGSSIAYLAADGPRAKDVREPLVIKRIQYKTRTSFSDNRRSHLWIVDVAAGKTRNLTPGEQDIHSIDWSPRGDEIVACSNRESDPDANWNNDLVLVKVADGSMERLTKTRGNEMTPVWSPDGASIAFTMTKRPLTTIDSVAEDAHVWLADRKTGQARELATKLDRRCSHLRWSQDNGTIFCIARDHGNQLIYRVPVNGDAATPVFTIEGVVTDFSLSAKGPGCCIFSTPTKPAEVYTFDLAGGPPVALTRFNVEAASRWKWIAPRRIECKSFDGLPIEGWLTIPSTATAAKKVPLILNIHGGPHGMHNNGFSPTLQLMAAHGYAVLSPNPRGSTGYGQAFSDGTLNDWGGGDYKDLIAILECAVAKHPELDGQRLGVTGGSYGGYMTNWVITQDNRFKAAVSYAGLSNLISFYATSLYQDLVHVEFGGMPWDRYDILWDRSPLKHIKRAKTPTLILHGEADFDVHISQSEELYTALKWLGVDSVFVRYPRQGHGASEPRQQLDMLERTLAWFDRYLKMENRPRKSVNSTPKP